MFIISPLATNNKNDCTSQKNKEWSNPGVSTTDKQIRCNFCPMRKNRSTKIPLWRYIDKILLLFGDPKMNYVYIHYSQNLQNYNVSVTLYHDTNHVTK